MKTVTGIEAERKPGHNAVLLNINELIREDHPSVYAIRVNTNIMVEVGIEKGDQVIVDRAGIPVNGSIVIAKIGNNMCIRKILISEGKRTLVCPGSHLSPLTINNFFICWGVVIYVLKKLD